jgi:hypothetical protein
VYSLSNAVDRRTSLTTLKLGPRCQTKAQSWSRPQSLDLLFNAVKFTPVGGMISIGIRLTKTWVEIDIANSGRGVEANDLLHV